MSVNRTLDSVVSDDVAPMTVLFGVVAGLSLGWTGASVLAGEPVSEYLHLVAATVAAAIVLYAVQSRP